MKLANLDGRLVLVLADGAPLAGDLYPQGDLEGQWFDDVHGVGWRLVTVDADAVGLDAALVAWFGSIGGAVVEVTGAAKDLVAWFEAHDVRWALARPDFHLFGAAADQSGAAGLLADLHRQLAPTPADRTSGRTS